MTITTLADGTLVSVEDGVIHHGIRTVRGILGIGILGTTPDITLGIAVLIGDGAEVGTPAGMVVGLAAGVGLAVGAEAGTPDLTETMFIMADQLTADTDEIIIMTGILQVATLQDEYLITTDTVQVVELRMADTAPEAEHQTDAIAVTMFAQQDVTVMDELAQQMVDTAQVDVHPV